VISELIDTESTLAIDAHDVRAKVTYETIGKRRFNRSNSLKRAVPSGWIVTTRMEWVTSENAPRPFPSADNGTMFFDCLNKVIAARRFVSAVFSEEWANT
jgi:hypothetical protein